MDQQTGAEIKTSSIVWEEAVDVTADQAIAASKTGQERAERRRVVFARHPGERAGTGEPRRGKGRRARAQQGPAGRAKQKMNIAVFKEAGKMDGRWFWSLAEHAPPEPTSS